MQEFHNKYDIVMWELKSNTWLPYRRTIPIKLWNILTRNVVLFIPKNKLL